MQTGFTCAIQTVTQLILSTDAPKTSQFYFEITFMLVDEAYVLVEICHESLD